MGNFPMNEPVDQDTLMEQANKRDQPYPGEIAAWVEPPQHTPGLIYAVRPTPWPGIRDAILKHINEEYKVTKGLLYDFSSKRKRK